MAKPEFGFSHKMAKTDIGIRQYMANTESRRITAIVSSSRGMLTYF